MLHLKKIIYQYEFMKCKVSNELIGYGDYYYEDDTDGLIVKASVFHEIQKRAKEEKFDYTKLNTAASQAEYRQMLKGAHQATLINSLADRKIFGKDS